MTVNRYFIILGVFLSACSDEGLFTGYGVAESPFFDKFSVVDPANISDLYVVASRHEYLEVTWSYDSDLGQRLNVSVFAGQRDGDNPVRVGDSICIETVSVFDCTDEASGLGVVYPYSIGQNGSHIGRIHRFEEE